jgi:hypothetical protein
LSLFRLGGCVGLEREAGMGCKNVSAKLFTREKETKLPIGSIVPVIVFCVYGVAAVSHHLLNLAADTAGFGPNLIMFTCPAAPLPFLCKSVSVRPQRLFLSRTAIKIKIRLYFATSKKLQILETKLSQFKNDWHW